MADRGLRTHLCNRYGDGTVFFRADCPACMAVVCQGCGKSGGAGCLKSGCPMIAIREVRS
jgi:hypothetical protein